MAWCMQDGYNGILVKDNPADIALGLEKLIGNSELRSILGRQAVNSMKRFAPDIIWSQWEELLFTMIKK